MHPHCHNRHGRDDNHGPVGRCRRLLAIPPSGRSRGGSSRQGGRAEAARSTHRGRRSGRGGARHGHGRPGGGRRRRGCHWWLQHHLRGRGGRPRPRRRPPGRRSGAPPRRCRAGGDGRAGTGQRGSQHLDQRRRGTPPQRKKNRGGSAGTVRLRKYHTGEDGGRMDATGRPDRRPAPSGSHQGGAGSWGVARGRAGGGSYWRKDSPRGRHQSTKFCVCEEKKLKSR